MSVVQYWVAILVATVTAVSSFLTLSKWIRRCWRVLSKIYNMAIVFFGEHEMMMNDYCIRRGILRHDAHNLASAIAKNSEWRANGETEKKSKAANGGGLDG